MIFFSRTVELAVTGIDRIGRKRNNSDQIAVSLFETGDDRKPCRHHFDLIIFVGNQQIRYEKE